METQKTQALAQQTVFKEEYSVQTRIPENSTLLSYFFSTEQFFKVKKVFLSLKHKNTL